MKTIEGSRVLVTGASRGIGLEIARAFLQDGGRVMINGRHPRSVQAAQAELQTGGEVHGFSADIRYASQCEQLLERTAQALGGIDCLINNAGTAWSGPFLEQPLGSVDGMIDTNVRGPLHLCRGILPHWICRGTGTIINISSGAAYRGMPDLAVYSATKAAINNFTQALAEEVTDYGIRVFAVCPGRVATDMQETVSGKRQGQPPEEVARRVVALAAGREPLAPGDCLDVTG